MASKQVKPIGCQDLLLDKNATGIWLRKQKKVFGKVFSPSGGWWYRRYAVILDKRIHFFKNEYSESYLDTIILHNCKITSIDEPIPNYPPWCFTIEMNDTNKKHWFSMSSEKELREITSLLNHACMQVTMRQCTLSKKPERRVSSGIESDNSAGSHFVESNNSAGSHFVDEYDADDDEDEKVDENEYETVGDFAHQQDETDESLSSSDEYLAASATATLLCTESPYVNISSIKNRGRPVPMVPSIAENSDEDYPQCPLPAPPIGVNRVPPLPVPADRSSVEPAVAAAAPQPIRERFERIAVEHVDTSSETSRVCSRGPRVAPKPQIDFSELERQARNEQLFQKRTYWHGSKEDAQTYLERKATEGMYLIRDGSEGKVLMYYCEGGCKNFRIRNDEQDRFYIVNKKLTFESIRDLVTYYSGDFLPNYEYRLRKAYNDYDD